MKKQFNHIALIGRARKDISDTLDAIKNYLLLKKKIISVEKNTAVMMSKHDLPLFTENHIPNDVDLMIVVGGDGSLLNAAHSALIQQIPVLGINRGQLGFLTDIHPDELSRIGDVIDGKYIIEERFLLSAHHQKPLGIALNDAILLPGNMAHLIEFEIQINKQFVCQQRADGLIIATPTGSTAYALSGGGPILHPSLNAVVLVPMFPHTLSSRPIVVDADSTIEIIISRNNESTPSFSCDGLPPQPVLSGDLITITKNKHPLKLVHPLDYEYFTTLRNKLGWQSSHQKNN